MHLIESSQEQLQQLSQLLESLTDQEYSRPIAVLSGASIGQHTRHIIEFFTEMIAGYQTGIICYDKRKRNQEIETNRVLAGACLADISRSVDKADKDLLLHNGLPEETNQSTRMPTNYFRELLYNVEHTVHHMALMRAGVLTITQLQMPDEFGVAASTLKFRQTCAQ